MDPILSSLRKKLCISWSYLIANCTVNKHEAGDIEKDVFLVWCNQHDYLQGLYFCFSFKSVFVRFVLRRRPINYSTNTRLNMYTGIGALVEKKMFSFV